jgi:hypothetical protein
LISAANGCRNDGGQECPRSSSPRQLDEAFEYADAGGVAHFAEGLGFDLADALAGDLELAASSIGLSVASSSMKSPKKLLISIWLSTRCW